MKFTSTKHSKCRICPQKRNFGVKSPRLFYKVHISMLIRTMMFITALSIVLIYLGLPQLDNWELNQRRRLQRQRSRSPKSEFALFQTSLPLLQLRLICQMLAIFHDFQWTVHKKKKKKTVALSVFTSF